jgi:hypothetical protein
VPPLVPKALDRLIELNTATNRPNEAKKWRAERAKYPEASECGRTGEEVTVSRQGTPPARPPTKRAVRALIANTDVSSCRSVGRGGHFDVCAHTRAGNDFLALTNQLSEQLLSCRIHEGESGEIKAGPAGRSHGRCTRFAHFVNPIPQELAFELDGLDRVRARKPSDPEHGEFPAGGHVVGFLAVPQRSAILEMEVIADRRMPRYVWAFSTSMGKLPNTSTWLLSPGPASIRTELAGTKRPAGP